MDDVYLFFHFFLIPCLPFPPLFFSKTCRMVFSLQLFDCTSNPLRRSSFEDSPFFFRSAYSLSPSRVREFGETLYASGFASNNNMLATLSTNGCPLYFVMRRSKKGGRGDNASVQRVGE